MKTDEPQRKAATARLARYAVVDSIACVVIGLSIFALVSDSGQQLHPLLANRSLMTAALGFASVVVVWSGLGIVRTLREMKQLQGN